MTTRGRSSAARPEATAIRLGLVALLSGGLLLWTRRRGTRGAPVDELSEEADDSMLDIDGLE